jgi:hypothetical protein
MTELEELPETAEKTIVEKLIKRGYRRTSSKYRVISRIDRCDWVDFLYDKVFSHRSPGIRQAVKAFYEGMPLADFGFMEATVALEASRAADHYRRCYSQDKKEGIDPEVFRLIPGSGGDLVGYCK